MLKGTTIWTSTVYWTIGPLYILLDLFKAPQWLRKYKIQPGTNEPVEMKRLVPVHSNINFKTCGFLIFWNYCSGCWTGDFQSICSGNSRVYAGLPMGSQTIGKNAARSCSTGLLTRSNRTGILHPRWRSGILLHPPVTSYTPTTNTINLWYISHCLIIFPKTNVHLKSLAQNSLLIISMLLLNCLISHTESHRHVFRIVNSNNWFTPKLWMLNVKYS